jgi:hypothetical protein
MGAVLEGHAAQDQRHDHDEEQRVEARQHRRVPGGEGRERRCDRGDQPDLVAVPDRADAADGHLTPGLVPAHHAVQHPDAEVEALQQEEPRPQDDQDDEPEDGECHRNLPGQ